MKNRKYYPSITNDIILSWDETDDITDDAKNLITDIVFIMTMVDLDNMLTRKIKANYIPYLTDYKNEK